MLYFNLSHVHPRTTCAESHRLVKADFNTEYYGTIFTKRNINCAVFFSLELFLTFQIIWTQAYSGAASRGFLISRVFMVANKMLKDALMEL